MFPSIRQPSAIQTASVTLAENVTGTGLVILEAPLGIGKTEAALYLADRWSQAIDSPGFYVALPTQATSNRPA
jgi:CRISPR-associated endonuclease/helicase Cas3